MVTRSPAGTRPPVTRDDEPIAATMRRSGIDRRTVLRWSVYMAGVLALPVIPYAERIAEAVEASPRVPVLWLNGQDCTGDSEGFLRASRPTPSELVLSQLSVDYAELLMAPSGEAASGRLADTMSRYAGKYLLIVEGSVPTANNGVFCCVGGRSFVDILKSAAAKALAVIAVGSCAAYGGLAAARGGVTGATSVAAVLAGTGKKVIALPGCPMNVENLTATVVQYLTLGAWPETDTAGRPLFAYGSSIHPNCIRLPFFEAGKFAQRWGDEGHRAGYCLNKVGCQGPSTMSNCPTAWWNSGTSYPIFAGSPCLGCTSDGFFDKLDPAFAWTPPGNSSAGGGSGGGGGDDDDEDGGDDTAARGA